MAEIKGSVSVSITVSTFAGNDTSRLVGPKLLRVINSFAVPPALKLLSSVVFSPQANYTYGEIDRRFLAKLVPTFADRGCRVVSATDPSGC
jgi:hypothetical protein